MGRRAKPSKDRVDTRPPRADHASTTDDGAKVRDLEQRLAEAMERLEASNRERVEALEQQSATAEILRVISRSQTDVQPVFDIIAANAARLCAASDAQVLRVEGDVLRLVAAYGSPSMPPVRSISRGHAVGRAVIDRRTIHVRDMAQAIAEFPETSSPRHGVESLLAVPLMRQDVAVGVIRISRTQILPFTEPQIALLQTFADQAVIAIENARLFSELQARTQELTCSVEQLTALGEVGRAVSSSLDLDTVLTTIVGRAVQLSGADGGTIFEYDEDAQEFSARAMLNADASQSAAARSTRLRRGEGAVGQMAVTREPVQIPDIAAEGAYESRIRGAMLASGTRSVLAVPLLHEDRIVGGLVVTRRVSGEFTSAVIELLRTFATQSALAIQNARLFREVEVKSRELEVASQHKSEFLASMSHELRTPLNAIIGFSDVLLEGMFGETNDKQTEYLRDILASGQHLLSLINDILDLSKIEAGRMELDVAPFDLPTAIDDTLLLMRERAARREITLGRHVDARVGEMHGDERKVKQVLLNLLSNAVKFTPEGGRIDVGAALAEGTVEISVTDTGIGIAAEDHSAVFEEFRQVGGADKKAEGTGLGLALCRRFVELHGGRIWVKSQLGAGSTFTFTLPVRGEDRPVSLEQTR
jgi:signal transduction histidine kinase